MLVSSLYMLKRESFSNLKINVTKTHPWDPEGCFWYVDFQTSRDLIPAAYENDKKLVESPHLSPSLTCIERIRAL